MSIGGGSAIDTAKGVVHFRLEESGTRLAHIAVPTTLSGGEFTGAAGITHGPIKKLYRGPHMPASLVLLDPDAAAITPLSLILPSGLNALHHCIEGVCSVRPNGMSDAAFLHAIRLLAATLPRMKAHPGDLEARGQAMVGAALAALAIPGVPMGMGHALAHAIGGRYKTPHATTHAILIASVMQYNHDAVPAVEAAIAQALGVSGNGDARHAARAGIERMRGLLVELGIRPASRRSACRTRRSRKWRRRRWTILLPDQPEAGLARRRSRGYSRGPLGRRRRRGAERCSGTRHAVSSRPCPRSSSSPS